MEEPEVDAALIERVLGNRTPNWVVYVKARLLDGLTAEEIADIHGVRVTSVRIILRAGERMIRRALEEAGTHFPSKGRMMYPMAKGHTLRHREVDFLIDPGSAPPELIASILLNLSELYEAQGGSGLVFTGLEEFETAAERST